jgi:hypothetical protein
MTASEARPVAPRERQRSWHEFGWACAEITALSALAIAQPVLDVFGRAPEVFVEAGAGRADLWLFAIAVALVPAIVLCAAELLMMLAAGETARRTLHLALIAALAALIAIRAVRLGIGIEGVVVLAMAVVFGVAIALLRARMAWFRTWLRWLAVAPVVLVMLFGFGSKASSLASASTGRADDAIDLEPAASSAARPPVVVLVLDELPTRSLLGRDGTIDAERFPGFAALAREATWYRNTTSVAANTAHAVPAILTGQYPSDRDRAPVATEHPDNVFRLLGNAYRFNVSELDTQLCVVPRCDFDDPDNRPEGVASVSGATASGSEGSALGRLFDRALDAYPDMVALHEIEFVQSVERNELDDVGSATTTSSAPTTSTGSAAPVDVDEATATTVDRTAARSPAVQPSRFRDWLARIDADADHPQLSLLHLTLPHYPWYIDSAGTVYRIPPDDSHLGGTVFNHWTDGPGGAITGRQRHLLQTRYVDTLLIALRERLETLVLWDDACVIVTADHGAGFNPGGGFREYDGENGPDLMGVPLFVHGPGLREGVIDDRPVQTVDVFPTLAAIAGVEIPWRVDGVDLGAPRGADRRTHPYAGVTRFTYGLETVDVTDHLDRLLALAADAPSVGGDDLTILRDGPAGDLIGTPLTDLDVAAEATGEAATIDFRGSDDYAPDKAGEVAALIVGHFAGGTPETVVVAAVDGVVAASASTFPVENAERFMLLLPPQWMRDGPHDVDLFRLDGTTLTPLTVV